MCIFEPRYETKECLHAECQILRTIKKINRPIFKRPKPAHSRIKEQHFFCNDFLNENEKMSVRSPAPSTESVARSSQKTINSCKIIEDGEKIAQLEKQVDSLRSELYTLRVRLATQGII